MNPQAQEELKILEERLQQSDVGIDINLKKRVYEILLEIQQYSARSSEYKRPGMLIILGYNTNKDDKMYCSEPDKSQNIFKYPTPKPVYLMTEEASRSITSTKDFDGALIINQNGYVTDSCITIKNIDPDAVLEEMGIPNDSDLSRRFGFAVPVHNRHTIAISASWELAKQGGITTYTLSRKTGILRMYESGRILHSQHPDEPVSPQSVEQVIEPSLNLN